MEKLATIVIGYVIVKEAVAAVEKIAEKNGEWIAIHILKK